MPGSVPPPGSVRHSPHDAQGAADWGLLGDRPIRYSEMLNQCKKHRLSNILCGRREWRL